MAFTSPEEHTVIAEMYPTALVQFAPDSTMASRHGNIVLMLQTSRGNMIIGWFNCSAHFTALDSRHNWPDVGLLVDSLVPFRSASLAATGVIEKYADIVKKLGINDVI